MANNLSLKSIFAKHPASKALVVLAIVAAAVVGLQYLKNSGRLGGEKSSASCYGYNCVPSVIVSGRLATIRYPGSPISGALNIQPGQAIELAWQGINVDSCEADWAKFTGPYYPPTFYGTVPASREFTVTCTSSKGVRAVGNLRVNVLRTNSGK